MDVPLSGPESVRRDTRLLLVSNDAMRARTRPVAVLGYHAYQLVLSALVAWPVSRELASIFGGHPRGDDVLFDPGGWALFALQRPYDRIAPGLSSMLLLLVCVGAAVGLAPLAALMTSLSHATSDTRAPRPRHLAPYVVASFRPLLGLFVLATALELALMLAAMWAYGAASGALVGRWGDARAAELGVLAFLLVMVVLSVVAVLHDLARAALIRFRRGSGQAMRAALSTFRQSSLRVWWSWAWRGLVRAALVGVVGWVLLRPPLTHGTTRTFIAIVSLHQLVALSRTALRASWLARALRAVDTYKVR